MVAQNAYGHFHVELNRGHHSRVATPEDPASSRMGESFWTSLPRTVFGSLASAWNLEAKRLRAQGRHVLSPRNDVLNSWAITVALFAVAIAWLGFAVIPFLVIQAVFGFSLLEVVSYVWHYGLLRLRTESGRYGRCNPEHSRNSNQVASNLALHNLERHSDNHAHPTRRYQCLRHFDDSPQLPNGYGLMIGSAHVPPLWRRIMEHRVVANYDGDLSRANLHPAHRDRLPAKYPLQPDSGFFQEVRDSSSIRTRCRPTENCAVRPSCRIRHGGARLSGPWGSVRDGGRPDGLEHGHHVVQSSSGCCPRLAVRPDSRQERGRFHPPGGHRQLPSHRR